MKDTKVLIIGMGRSGRAAAKALIDKGAVVSIQDLAFHTIAVGKGDATLLNGKRSACPIITHIVCRTPIP